MKLEYPILKKWSLFKEPPANPFMAPELGETRLQGEVYGHERFPDGAPVSTSAVQTLLLEQGQLIARTRNTTYILNEEDMDPAYETAYPGAYNRLIASIEQ